MRFDVIKHLQFHAVNVCSYLHQFTISRGELARQLWQLNHSSSRKVLRTSLRWRNRVKGRRSDIVRNFIARQWNMDALKKMMAKNDETSWMKSTITSLFRPLKCAINSYLLKTECFIDLEQTTLTIKHSSRNAQQMKLELKILYTVLIYNITIREHFKNWSLNWIKLITSILNLKWSPRAVCNITNGSPGKSLCVKIKHRLSSFSLRLNSSQPRVGCTCSYCIIWYEKG